MDLLIHIGTHKTGTTTIQRALRHAAQSGADRDWARMKMPGIAKQFMRAERYDDQLVERFKTELQRVAQKRSSARALVMSSEALCGMPTNGYLSSGVIAAMLRDATLEHNAKIIIYLRRQDLLVESLYTQLIQEGGVTDFGSFLQRFDDPEALDYDRMLGQLRSYFGDQRLVVRSYHQASERGLLQDFGEIIGDSALYLPEDRERNRSYSRNALEIAKRCNEVLDSECQKKLRSALQRTMGKPRCEPFSYFSDPEREAFLQRFQASNAAVAQRYFEGSPEATPDPRLGAAFPTPEKPKAVCPSQSISHDDVAKLVVQLLEQSKSPRRGGIAKVRATLSGLLSVRNLF